MMMVPNHRGPPRRGSSVVKAAPQQACVWVSEPGLINDNKLINSGESWLIKDYIMVNECFIKDYNGYNQGQ